MCTRSAWLLKIFKVDAAMIASRSEFCWNKKSLFVPGSGAVQIPHSSTTSAFFFWGSYLSMMAECLDTISSILSACCIALKYSFSPKEVADPEGGHFPESHV